MSLGAILYRIIIGPLELFFEVVFMIADRHVNNPAYAIIFLSIAMNFLVLPLYRRADAIQAEERDRENALAPWIKHIKKTFKGDERFMMLQAFYRENNYKPTDSLKGSVSLLLEIPFFIAAYHFLSHLQMLMGVSFGPITDLGAPDGLLTIGSVTLNLLPILMTLINVISAAIYMKGFPLKSKIQMYGVAAIFLVFLYKSPAGLVFYWTLNNLFSLIKNIFYRIPNPGKALRIFSSATGLAILISVLFVHPMASLRGQCLIILGALCLQIPLLIRLNKLTPRSVKIKNTSPIFFASTAFLTILSGILIPSSVLADSTEEFLSISKYYSPYWYIVSTFTIAFGTFMVWFTIFFKLASRKSKQTFSLIMAIVAVAAAVNYMFFGKNYGNLSSVLVFDKGPVIDAKNMLINVSVLVLIAIIILIVFIKKSSIIKVLSIAMCITLAVMSVMNIAGIQKALKSSASLIKIANENEPKIALSKSGKNVVVIMMDRQIGHFIPFIMHEKPELKVSFAGFTYYANSFSYGTFTNVGTPGLYGGYDYTPAEMNKRNNLKLVDKQNEALKVMPKLFSDAGYNVTVMDPTYAGYKLIPDLSIYDDMPKIHKSISMGKFSLNEYSYKTSDDSEIQLRMRNAFLYSIFKMSPQFIQPTIYSRGTYNAPKNKERIRPQEIISNTESVGMNEDFLQSYAVLSHLSDITKINTQGNGSFLMMSNDLTHGPMMLQEPSFTPAEHVNNEAVVPNPLIRKDDAGNVLKMETKTDLIHYQTNVAAMVKLGEWFDYLKRKNIYDNTRIIIVSDHGRNLEDNSLPFFVFKDANGKEKSFNAGFFDSVLLVKDFGASQFTTKQELISNADTPSLATNGIIKNPQNPFTGNKILGFENQKGEPQLIYTDDYQTDKNSGHTFLPSDWFTVHNNIYKQENWKYLGYR